MAKETNKKAFVSAYEDIRGMSEAAGTYQSQDPRPKQAGGADNALIGAGYAFAKNNLPNLNLPALDRLNDAQRAEMRETYFPQQQLKRQSEAYALVNSKGSIEGMVQEAALDDKKLSTIESLLMNDDFAQRGGIAGDKDRGMYAEFLNLEHAAKSALKGPQAVDEELRGLFFGEASQAYAEGVVKKLKDAKIYTPQLLGLTRSAARRAFIEGSVIGKEYEATVKRVVHKAKAKFAGVTDSDPGKVEEAFKKSRHQRASRLMTSAADTMINKGSTEVMHYGMQALRSVL